MMRVALLSSFLLLVVGCPDKERRDKIEEVGGAPKRQLDNVRDSLGKSSKLEHDLSDRADKAGKIE